MTAIGADSVTTACVFTGDLDPKRSVGCNGVLSPPDCPRINCWTLCTAREAQWAQAGLKSVHAAGDAWAPATIAAAVWAGHRYAEELDEPTDERPVPFRREVTQLSTENRDLPADHAGRAGRRPVNSEGACVGNSPPPNPPRLRIGPISPPT